MSIQKAQDLIRLGMTSDFVTTNTKNIEEMIKGAGFNVCKELINMIKKIIKDKSNSPTVKLRVFKLFHTCMMADNTSFLIYAQKKILTRLTKLAKHKKHMSDDNRGDDL